LLINEDASSFAKRLGLITSVDSGEVIGAILQTADQVHLSVDYLTKLDSQLGDGDHGTNLDRGFAEVRRELTNSNGADVGVILESIGETLVSSMGGASGPLLGAAFSSAGRAVKGKSEVGIVEIVTMFEAAESAVARLGGARVGDKTVLDSLHPAAVAARKMLEQGDPDLVRAFEYIVAAANSGLETTKTLVAKKGRAMYLGDRGLGTPDVGAASFCIILESALAFLRRLNEGKETR